MNSNTLPFVKPFIPQSQSVCSSQSAVLSNGRARFPLNVADPDSVPASHPMHDMIGLSADETAVEKKVSGAGNSSALALIEHGRGERRIAVR